MPSGFRNITVALSLLWVASFLKVKKKIFLSDSYRKFSWSCLDFPVSVHGILNFCSNSRSVRWFYNSVFWFVASKKYNSYSVIRIFFLKNTDVGPKKHEKHQKKSQKTREKHEFFAKISKNLTHPTFFIAFLCINIFKVEKIGNFFQKNVQEIIFLEKFWPER